MALSRSPTITRGRLTIPDRGIVKEFMFNPPDVTDDKGVYHGTLELPGASHPVFQYASGGPREISFERSS
jgi:hypothetical protein